jgi:cytochrome c oxidase cbb3-type subunit 2
MTPVPSRLALIALCLVFVPTAHGQAPQDEEAPPAATEEADEVEAEVTEVDAGEETEQELPEEAESPEDEEEWEDEEWEDEPLFEPRTIDPGLLSRGRTRGAVVYRQYCGSCHGTRGDGRGPAARFLSVTPRNLTSGVYKWRTTPSGELPSDGDLLRTVRQGAPGTPMPAWEGRLSMWDMWSVVQYIKMFSTRFVEEPAAEPLPMPATVPRFDDATRRRGRLMYVLLQCWTCHGMDGTGDGPAADTLEDDEGNPSIAYDFTRQTMRAGNRSIDIYRTYASGVNGTPMPSYDEGIIVGRDGYEDLSTFEPVMSAEGMRELRRFVGEMPLTEELWALPDEERRGWAVERRWELVAYVESLSTAETFWRYLWAAPYAN